MKQRRLVLGRNLRESINKMMRMLLTTPLTFMQIIASLKMNGF